MKAPAPKKINGKMDWTDTIEFNLKRFIKEYKCLNDEFGPIARNMLGTLPYEDRKPYYLKKLKQLIKKNPDGEYWLPLVYYPNTNYGNQTKKKDQMFNFLWVSNKGRLFDIRRYSVPKLGVTNNGYLVFGMKNYAILVHRAIACTFIPKPDRHVDIPFSNLEVNHLNADKQDPALLNLEWCTSYENSDHANKLGLMINHKGVKHGNVKPMMGVVVDITGFKRKKIYVCGREECLQYGLSNKVLYKLRKGQIKTYRGCEWKEITLNEYIRNREVPNPVLLEQINNYRFERTGKGNTRADKNVWKLTHIRTKHVRIISGTIEQRKLGMYHGDLAKAAESKKPYKNYLVEKQIAR